MNRNELIRALRQEDEGKFQPKMSEEMIKMLETSGLENLHPTLKAWVDHETILGPMVKHPFVFMHAGGDDGLMVGSVNDFYAHKIKARREYLNRGHWYGYLKSWERPYRMIALEKLWVRKKISLEQLRELLADMWIDTECPEGDRKSVV